MPGRRSVAVIASCLLPGVACPSQVPAQAPPAVVLQTTNARLNTNDAIAGTTVFDGDRLETQPKGLLSLRSGQIQITLSEESTLWMNHEGSVVTPVLQRGTVTFRTETGSGIEVRADDVRVRAHNPALTVGQVTLEECFVVATAITQPLEVTAGKETKILDEGKTYRVARLGTCAGAQNHPPVAPAHNRFFLAAAVIAGGILIPPIVKVFESPDHP